MQPQLLYIDALIGTARAQTTGPTPPAISALLGCTLVLKAGFMESGTLGPITDYTADSLRLVVKPADDPDAVVSLFPAGVWAASGTTTATRYTWTGLANSAQLETLIGTAAEIVLKAQFEWMISTDTNPQKSLPFDLRVINSPARIDDGAPDVAGEAAKAWLEAMLAEGDNVTLTVHPTTGVITIAADFSAAAGAMTYKGVIDASANPNYPAASQGDTYAISVAGKIGGASGITVEIGDVIVCKTTAVSGNHATVGTSWTILQSNITGITSDGLALIQAASVSIQRGLLGLSKDVDGGVPSYTHALHVYAQRTSDVALNNVANATGDYIECTDSGQTFSASTLGTAPAGTVIHARFTGVNTLTHDASTFILPTGANITTAAGDVATFRSRAGGSASWLCTAYQRASGSALVSPTIAALASQAEAEAGTENTKTMTALRVAEAIAALAPSGGGGSALMRGSGLLEGSDVAAAPGEPPPDVSVTFDGVTHVNGSIQYVRNGTAYDIYFDDMDPSQTYWIDTTSFTTPDELAAALASVINAIGGSTASYSGAVTTIMHGSTGIASTHAGYDSFADISGISGGGAGVDAIAESGSVTEVTLIAQDGTKKIMPVRLFAYDATGIAAAVHFELKDGGGSYYRLCVDVPSGEFYAEPMIGPYYNEWYGAGRGGCSLVARYTGTPPLGGSLRCVAIAEQY